MLVSNCHFVAYWERTVTGRFELSVRPRALSDISTHASITSETYILTCLADVELLSLGMSNIDVGCVEEI